MISTQDIRDKEVINIYDGKSMGFVDDMEIDLQKGTIEGIVVPSTRRMFSFFGRDEDTVIRWRDVKRIGEDVILVEVPGLNGLHTSIGMVYNDEEAHKEEDE
ncbi:MAG TPA: YlmC/YmxH family sporulation protein [Anaerovoracaceae bacterium]|nr:YlmC/YmxH family sporulation protein [Anaerovoracaceae bacterium]